MKIYINGILKRETTAQGSITGGGNKNATVYFNINTGLFENKIVQLEGK